MDIIPNQAPIDLRRAGAGFIFQDDTRLYFILHNECDPALLGNNDELNKQKCYTVKRELRFGKWGVKKDDIPAFRPDLSRSLMANVAVFESASLLRARLAGQTPGTPEAEETQRRLTEVEELPAKARITMATLAWQQGQLRESTLNTIFEEIEKRYQKETNLQRSIAKMGLR